MFRDDCMRIDEEDRWFVIYDLNDVKLPGRFFTRKSAEKYAEEFKIK